MSSIGEGLMQNVLARLEGSPSLMLGAQNVNVKRSHRTPVPRDEAPMVHLVDGDDLPKGRADGECRTARTKHFSVDVFVRDDQGVTVADPLIVEVQSRLHPRVLPAYPGNLRMGPIRVDEEIADGDAIRVTLNYECDYNTTGWALDA